MADDTQTEPRLKTLKNGAVYDLDKGRIVANPGGGKSAITPERSRELREMRAAKTAALIRKRITEATAKVSTLPINSTAEAVADVAGILWAEIVLNQNEYARDRLAAFKELSERAEMTSKDKREEPQKTMSDALAAAVPALVALLREAQQPPRDVVDGTVTDPPSLSPGEPD
jgi:hypothetical protein